MSLPVGDFDYALGIDGYDPIAAALFGDLTIRFARAEAQPVRGDVQAHLSLVFLAASGQR